MNDAAASSPGPPSRWRPGPILGAVVSLVLALHLVSGAPLGQAGEAGKERPLPRFASLRADKVNLRAGPGKRYPVEWVFVRRGLPVEIIAEYEHWRKVRWRDGTVGWVHQSMLSGRRTVIVRGEVQTLRAAPRADARAVLKAGTGVQGALVRCAAAWCEVEIAGHSGWIERRFLWGVYPDETIK